MFIRVTFSYQRIIALGHMPFPSCLCYIYSKGFFVIIKRLGKAAESLESLCFFFFFFFWHVSSEKKKSIMREMRGSRHKRDGCK
jgi:hypothetical protein